jgi:hypothetical protein
VLANTELLSSCALTVPFSHLVAEHMGMCNGRVPMLEELMISGGIPV